MQDAVSIPVTIKCRTGIDDLDSLEHLTHFVGTIAETGTRTFIIHARIAVLEGLSPKQNREIPPLNYERVFSIKDQFPSHEIVINGGIKTLQESRALLEKVDGVMIGREAYQNPGLLAHVDQELFSAETPVITEHEALEKFISYADRQMAEGVALKHMSKHILGLFQGQPGAKRFRRYISENAHKPDAGIEVLETAAAIMQNQLSTQEKYLGEATC